MLKLTTDKLEASRGLSATAELLVLNQSVDRCYRVAHSDLHDISRTEYTLRNGLLHDKCETRCSIPFPLLQLSLQRLQEQQRSLLQ